MRELATIDVLNDRQVQRAVTHGSWALLLVQLAGGALIAFVGPLAGLHVEHVDAWWLVAFVMVSIAVLPVHELIHAAMFVLLGGDDVHVSFGFQDFMLYTSAAGAVLPRRRFLVVLVAPSVLLSLMFVATGVMESAPLFAWMGLMLHLAGCTGDLAMARAIVREPRCTHVLDTSSGITLLARERDRGRGMARGGRQR